MELPLAESGKETEMLPHRPESQRHCPGHAEATGGGRGAWNSQKRPGRVAEQGRLVGTRPKERDRRMTDGDIKVKVIFLNFAHVQNDSVSETDSHFQ